MEFSKKLLSNLTMKYMKPDGFDVWLQEAQADIIEVAESGFWGTSVCVPKEYYNYACEYFIQLGIFMQGVEKKDCMPEIELNWR